MTGPQGHLRNLVLLAFLAALPGCGASNGGRVPVEGKVFLDAQPLSKGIVILRPDAGKGNLSKHEPRGKIDAQGRYRIATGKYYGALPGWYKVGVIANDETDSRLTYALPRPLIPRHYNNPDHAGIYVEIVAEAEPGTYDLQLRGKSERMRR
jgi:hypothetical protein